MIERRSHRAGIGIAASGGAASYDVVDREPRDKGYGKDPKPKWPSQNAMTPCHETLLWHHSTAFDAEHSYFRLPRGDTACRAVLGPCRAALRHMYQKAEPWERFFWCGSSAGSIQVSGGEDSTSTFVRQHSQSRCRWTCALGEALAEPQAVGKVGSQCKAQ